MLSVARIKKIFRITLAVVLLLVGIFGLVLPILNGVIPIVIGLILLSFESKYLEGRLEHFARKNHHVEHWYHRLAKRMRTFFRINS